MSIAQAMCTSFKAEILDEQQSQVDNNESLLIIQDSENITNITMSNYYHHNKPESCEQEYYRAIFSKYYNKCDNLIPYFWMPKFIKGVADASARTLDVYKSKK